MDPASTSGPAAPPRRQLSQSACQQPPQKDSLCLWCFPHSKKHLASLGMCPPPLAPEPNFPHLVHNLRRQEEQEAGLDLASTIPWSQMMGKATAGPHLLRLFPRAVYLPLLTSQRNSWRCPNHRRSIAMRCHHHGQRQAWSIWMTFRKTARGMNHHGKTHLSTSRLHLTARLDRRSGQAFRDDN